MAKLSKIEFALKIRNWISFGKFPGGGGEPTGYTPNKKDRGINIQPAEPELKIGIDNSFGMQQGTYPLIQTSGNRFGKTMWAQHWIAKMQDAGHRVLLAKPDPLNKKDGGKKDHE